MAESGVAGPSSPTFRWRRSGRGPRPLTPPAWPPSCSSPRPRHRRASTPSAADRVDSSTPSSDGRNGEQPPCRTRRGGRRAGEGGHRPPVCVGSESPIPSRRCRLRGGRRGRRRIRPWCGGCWRDRPRGPPRSSPRCAGLSTPLRGRRGTADQPVGAVPASAPRRASLYSARRNERRCAARPAARGAGG